MSAVELVQQCWNDLTARAGCAASAAAEVLDEAIRAYAEPHRHYHTLDHIAALLALLSRHADAATDRDALTSAIVFHDIVYDPAKEDNEAASASLATDRLTRLGFAEGLVAKIGRYILATRHTPSHEPAGDPDLALLLDLDLSILAAEPAQYRAYAQAIRHEYAHVPDTIYRPGRRRVLERFLARQPIYRTERLRALWEAQARANLAAEMAGLGQVAPSDR